MIQPPSRSHAEVWPALPYGTWKDTCTTLHLWTQIVGKIRLAQTPWANILLPVWQGLELRA